MLQIQRYVNELMTSNCYVVYDDILKHCIIIDPGSEKSLREIEFINSNYLKADYIIITHEHTDHNWGVNSLLAEFKGIKLVSSAESKKWVNKANRAYFLFYYDDPDYRYEMQLPDVTINSDEEHIDWIGYKIEFVLTPGHSFGSMCIKINNMLFTGDTIMPYKPFFNGRDSNEDDWESSMKKCSSLIPLETIVYPGHGSELVYREWLCNKEYQR